MLKASKSELMCIKQEQETNYINIQKWDEIVKKFEEF